MGGGRHSNCSVLEAIALCEEIGGRKMSRSYDWEPRKRNVFVSVRMTSSW